jgi:glycosyltransferase involved in cell wall biosynthesis
MEISQWNLLKPTAGMSGLKRYSDEIHKQCSMFGTINRYYSTGNKLETFLGYKPGDVTHITTQQIAFMSLFKHVKNCVVTVHDLIESHWYSPQRQFKELWFLNELFLKNSGHFITDSAYTKMDLMNTFGVSEENIDVVYLGVDHKTFYPEDHELCRTHMKMFEDEVYVLANSSGEPWKNTRLLGNIALEPDHNIKIIDIGYGRGKWGYVDDEMLRILYSACDAFLAPSKAEGFGLPILEAQACGCPVVASNCTSYPEVVGQGGQLVNPDNTDQWIEAIEKAVKHRKQWGNRGIVNAKKFSWEHTGKQTWDVYEKIRG